MKVTKRENWSGHMQKVTNSNDSMQRSNKKKSLMTDHSRANSNTNRCGCHLSKQSWLTWLCSTDCGRWIGGGSWRDLCWKVRWWPRHLTTRTETTMHTRQHIQFYTIKYKLLKSFRTVNSLSTQLGELDITLIQFRRALKTHLFGHWQLQRRGTVFCALCINPLTAKIRI